MKRVLVLSALLLAACSQPPSNVVQGYGEADYVYLSSQETGVVRQVFVREGDVVQPGAPVFRLEPNRLSYTAASASASTSSLRDAVTAARADADLARRNYARGLQLYQQGFYPRATLDAARSQRDAADAHLAQAIGQLRAGSADTGLAEQRLSDLDVNAPEAGSIERIFHRPGEVVPAGQPIASLLTPRNLKVRFFVPEALLSHVRPGVRVAVSCDNCPAMTARVTRVATEAQFTPPVIYSLEERAKLVYLVDARLEGNASVRPGQPLLVRVP